MWKKLLFVTRRGGVLTTPFLDFCYKASDSYDFGTEDDKKYEPPLSIDTNKVPVAFHFTSQWRNFNT